MNRPIVGVGVVIMRGNKVLVGQRLSAVGKGTWGLPGGHLELGETPEECAAREVLEETGLVFTPRSRGPYSSIVCPSGQHFVSLIVIGVATGDAVVTEPTKCAEWLWRTWDDLPQPLFKPLEDLVASGFRP